MDPVVLKRIIGSLQSCSRDGLNLAEDGLAQLDLALVYHPALLARWLELMGNKADRDLSAQVSALRAAAIKTLETLLADDDAPQDPPLRLALATAHAALAPETPHPAVMRVASGGLDLVLGAAPLRAALAAGDVAAAREALAALRSE